MARGGHGEPGKLALVKALLLAEVERLCDAGTPFPGWMAIARGMGIRRTQVDYARRHLLRERAFVMEDERRGPSGIWRRIVLPDGRACGWGVRRSGVRQPPIDGCDAAAEVGERINPPKPPAPVPADVEQLRAARVAEAKAAAEAARRAHAAPTVMLTDAATIEAALARSFPALAATIDRDNIAERVASGGRESWVQTLARLVELGALVADDCRAEVGEEV